MTQHSGLVYYHLGNGRDLSVRFRLVWVGLECRFEPLSLDRPFGLPIGDGIPRKACADVLLEAYAYPIGLGDSGSKVRLCCGGVERELSIFGARFATHESGRIHFTRAKAFERVRLDHRNAYGGGLRSDRFYPPNPMGKGFVTRDRFAEGLVELPLIEEGSRRLHPDNLLADWERWWLQPTPALVEPTLPTNMPRFRHFGVPTPYPMPLCDSLSSSELLQEAGLHSRVIELPQGTPIEVVGCLPGGACFRAKAPRSPRLNLTVAGMRRDVQVRPQTIRIRPEASEISITYGVELKLERTFLPGVHAAIPIATEVEGLMVPFPVEEPLLRRIRRAQSDYEARTNE